MTVDLSHDTAKKSVDYRVVNAQFRQHLQTCEGQGWNHFDDVVFKIAAGGLALSVTFLGVTDQVESATMPWVFGAWGFWAISLLAILFSIRTAQSALRSQIAHWDAGSYYDTKRPEGRAGWWTSRLNDVAAATCGLGLVFLIVFAFLNL